MFLMAWEIEVILLGISTSFIIKYLHFGLHIFWIRVSNIFYSLLKDVDF
ncbi:MAG: hypothetical protein ACI8ZN_001478 [Bacteroidia bacterium]|jgi:hypothetical protein